MTEIITNITSRTQNVKTYNRIIKKRQKNKNKNKDKNKAKTPCFAPFESRCFFYKISQ